LRFLEEDHNQINEMIAERGKAMVIEAGQHSPIKTIQALQAPMLATSSHSTTSFSLLIGQRARTGERSPSMLPVPQPTSPIQQICSY
jgi:hypothetical protein